MVASEAQTAGMEAQHRMFRVMARARRQERGGKERAHFIPAEEAVAAGHKVRRPPAAEQGEQEAELEAEMPLLQRTNTQKPERAPRPIPEEAEEAVAAGTEAIGHMAEMGDPG